MRLTLVVCLLVVTAFAFGVKPQQYKVQSGETVMKLTVSGRGNILVKLFMQEAPKTTAHIVDLVKRAFYNGQRFHKVVRSPRPFVAQIGDPASRSGDLNESGSGGSGTRIPYEETGVSHEEGVVALASPAEDKDGGDSQFFFVLSSSRFLDGKYTVFGRVVAGLEVMRTIQVGDRLDTATILTK